MAGVRDADELHDALLSLITLPPVEEWKADFSAAQRPRAAPASIERDGKRFWVATERLHLIERCAGDRARLDGVARSGDRGVAGRQRSRSRSTRSKPRC